MTIDSEFKLIISDPFGLLLLLSHLPPRRLWRFWRRVRSAHERH